MINETTTSVRGAPSARRVALCTRGGVRKWVRLAPLVLAILVAATVTFIGADRVLAQDDVLADVLKYVESHFGGYGLRQASAVALSPDDKHLYVSSEQDDAVVHFTRESTAGDLTYEGTYVNGENGVTGLNDPVDLATSPDGKNLYVAGKEDDAIVVFMRDTASGALTFVETQTNDTADVENMLDPDAVSVSPDGMNVYVAGDAALTVFHRSAGDGSLEFVESEQGSGGGTSFQLRDVVVSPDNSHVYVTSHLENAVAVLDRDGGDMGKVTVSQVVADGAGGVTGLFLAEKLSVSPDGANVYATGAISPTGAISGTVVVFNRGGDGMLVYAETHVTAQNGVDGIAGARSVETSADGKNVYVAGTTDNTLAVFNRGAGGSLSFADCFTANASGTSCTNPTAGLKNPSGVVVATDGGNLYVTGKESDAIVVFTRNPADGALTQQDVLTNSDGGVSGLGGADDVAVSPDGKHVYVSATSDNSVVVFERSAGAMGTLQFVEAQKEGEGGVQGLLKASSVTVSPDGKNVYATGYEDGTVVVFARDSASGALTYVETKQQAESGVAGIKGAWGVVVSADGKSVYATGSLDDAVAVLSRDAATGKLTADQLVVDGINGVTGLRGASGIVVSPDDKHVYVAGSNDDSVVAFSRDGASGELTIVEAYSGLSGLNGAVSVDVSGDGKNVYVASVVDGTVVVFNRDSASGKLSYAGGISTAADEEADANTTAEQSVSTLSWSVAVSPDGKYVYAANWEVTDSKDDPTGNVTVFARDAGSGQISKAQVLRNDEGDIRGLRSPTALTTSADGKNVYATSIRDSAVLVFDITGSAEYEDIQFLPLMVQE